MTTYERFAPHAVHEDNAPAAAATPKRSSWRGIYEAFLETQRIRAHREVDRKLGAGAFERALRMQLPPEKEK
jgi:hypothetical protein